MPSGIVAMVLGMGMVVSMTAIALPAFLEKAEAARDFALAQAEADRAAAACVRGADGCFPLHDGERLVCVTSTDLVTHTETTECHVERKTPPTNVVTP